MCFGMPDSPCNPLAGTRMASYLRPLRAKTYCQCRLNKIIVMPTKLKEKFPFGAKAPTTILVFLLLAGMAVTTARGAASLLGEQVTLTVRYQVSPQGGGFIDQVLYTSTFTVGAGVEVSSQPV